MTPPFIVLEGCDGSGKSTQCRLLTNRLMRGGSPTRLTREPSAGAVGRLIRQRLRREADIATEAMGLLYAADRADHAAREILPALARGEVVVCDRYILSNVVYRMAEQDDGTPLGRVCAASAGAQALRLSFNVPAPTLTIVIDVPAELAAERRRARGEDAKMYEDEETQRRVCALYQRASALVPGDRVVMVDGTGAEGEVAARVWAAAEEVLQCSASVT